jgi:hypothetical protein
LEKKEEKDNSLYYPFLDPGIIVRREIIPDKNDSGKISSVKIEVLIRRTLKIGDFLTDGHNHNFIVAKIVPIAEMPVFKHKRVDILLPANAQFSFLRQGEILPGRLWLKKVLGKTRAGYVKLEKTTCQVEEKSLSVQPAPTLLLVNCPLINFHLQAKKLNPIR